MCKIKLIEEILFFYNFLLQMDMKKENMDVNEHDRLSNATLLKTQIKVKKQCFYCCNIFHFVYKINLFFHLYMYNICYLLVIVLNDPFNMSKCPCVSTCS
jgi:hypothetical protein